MDSFNVQECYTDIIPKDEIEDVQTPKVIEYIRRSPENKLLVDIDDAFLTAGDLQCLIHDNIYLHDGVICAYIYCLRAQEHLGYRIGGNVYLENSIISSLIKRDRTVQISSTDQHECASIIRRVSNYLDHDMVFLPINIKDCHWYLAVINAKKREIQVLDSLGITLARNDLTTTLQGLENHLNIVSQWQDLKCHKWQDINVTTWPVIEQLLEPTQTDGSSCGLFMLKYMEYWTGDSLSDHVTQEDMTNWRQKLAVILVHSELNKAKENLKYNQTDGKGKIFKAVINSGDEIQYRSSECVVPTSMMPQNTHELVEALCKYILSIDHAESLEKQWVLSSKPYHIGLSLKKLQGTLKMDHPMDIDCFNMGVRILACDELQMLRETQVHYMDLTFCRMSDFERDPRHRTRLDVQRLAKLFDSWPGIDYSISSCKLILLPYAFLGHFMLFVFDQDARTISILDSLPMPTRFKDDPIMRYIFKIQKIGNNLKHALEVANPSWNDDTFLWRRIIPLNVPTNPDSDVSGYFIFYFMRSWNGESLEQPVCKDGYELRKQFLVHLLKYDGNECGDNIPHIVQEFLKRINK